MHGRACRRETEKLRARIVVRLAQTYLVLRVARGNCFRAVLVDSDGLERREKRSEAGQQRNPPGRLIGT